MARNVEFVFQEKIEKAMHVFWEKGYKGASLSDLTHAMKLNKSSLYNSFGDKHELFKECLKYYIKFTELDYASGLEKKGNALHKIDSIVDGMVKLSIERPNSCLGIMTSFELGSHFQDVHAIIKDGNEKRINLIKSLIEDAQSGNLINSKRDAATLANHIFYSFSGLRQCYIIKENPQLVKNLGKELKAFLRM
jgi:TetR/AcrR family transcriptional repressor of nem operon